jgi:glutamate/tyrosine decarboxylase-like PLP-dependent enzyme
MGEDAEKVLDELFREMVEQGFHVPSANYFGLMNPTPTYMGFLGEALVAALNPQLATLARSQLASKIELETMRWIGERVGWPGQFNGTFTSGGNEANFSGLALALASKFPEAVEEGVAAIGGQPVLYASAEAHHSLEVATRENLELVLSGQPPRYVVNPAVLPAWIVKWGAR